MFHKIKFAVLKKRIKNNPYIGIKDNSGVYAYKQGSYEIRYRIIKNPLGKEDIEWISDRRRLSRREEKNLRIKRNIDNFFIYRRWFVLFRPSVVIILSISLTIFYFGIREYSLRRIEHFKWIIARISGITPESIGYVGGGRFRIYGQRGPVDKKVEPVTIHINPLTWLLFGDTANVQRWNKEVNKYIDYSLTINDKGDVWLGKKGSEAHGKMLGDNVIWDEPQGTRKVPSQNIITEDRKLKIADE